MVFNVTFIPPFNRFSNVLSCYFYISLNLSPKKFGESSPNYDKFRDTAPYRLSLMCLSLLGLEKLEHFNLSFHLINYFIHKFIFFL